MEEQEVDQLSRQLKIENNPKSILTSVLNQENLDKLKESTSQFDNRSLTEKLNSIKPKEEYAF